MKTLGHVRSSSLRLRLTSHHLAVFWSLLLTRRRPWLVAMLQRQRLPGPAPHAMLRIAFVAVDRRHAPRSVTHSHDAQGLGLAADASRYLRTPVAVLVRATAALNPPPALGSLSGMDKHPLRSPPVGTCSSRPPRAVWYDNSPSGQGSVRVGDASRNTATIAVSREHRAGQVRSGQLMRTGIRAHGRGREKASRLRDRGRARRVSLRGGPIVTKKDNAGRQ